MTLVNRDAPPTARTPDGSTLAAVGRFAFPIYFTALLFVVTPVVDAVTNVWPVQNTAQWRFGFAGASANYLVSLVFGAVLACVTAAALGHRRTLRVFGVLSALFVLLLLALLMDFTLSSIQYRSMVGATNLPAFGLAVVKATIKYVTAAAVLVVTSFVAIRSSSPPPPKPKR